MNWELEKELYEAGKRYKYWPYAIETFEYNISLPCITAEKRQEFYAQKAELQREALRYFEETKHCGSFVSFFGTQCSTLIFFNSPWKRRLKACSDYVRAAAGVWNMADTSWAYRRQWLSFFNRHKEEVRKSWMTEKELSVLHSLSKPFTLYRGYNKPHAKMGLSWTLDIRVAAKSPHFRAHGKANPWIIAAIANPEDVIAYLDGRQEREIIIDPKRILKIIRQERAEEAVHKDGNKARTDLLRLLSIRYAKEHSKAS